MRNRRISINPTLVMCKFNTKLHINPDLKSRSFGYTSQHELIRVTRVVYTDGVPFINIGNIGWIALRVNNVRTVYKCH